MRLLKLQAIPSPDKILRSRFRVKARFKTRVKTPRIKAPGTAVQVQTRQRPIIVQVVVWVSQVKTRIRLTGTDGGFSADLVSCWPEARFTSPLDPRLPLAVRQQWT